MNCPNCGAAVAGDARFCPECGAALGEPAGSQGGDRKGGDTPGGRPGQDRRQSASGPADAERTRPAADARPDRQSQQPGAEVQREQTPSAQPRQAAPEGGRDGGESGGISRRALLAGSAGVLGVAAAGGWYLFLREAGPVAAARRSWEAWTDGDFETFEQVVHSDSPLRENWPQDFGENFGPREGTELTMESRELLEQGETEAVVREVYVWDPPDGSPRRVTDRLTLRTEEGAWKLWDVRNTGDQPVEG
jgi:hypothetical protein